MTLVRKGVGERIARLILVLGEVREPIALRIRLVHGSVQALGGRRRRRVTGCSRGVDLISTTAAAQVGEHAPGGGSIVGGGGMLKRGGEAGGGCGVGHLRRGERVWVRVLRVRARVVIGRGKRGVVRRCLLLRSWLGRIPSAGGPGGGGGRGGGHEMVGGSNGGWYGSGRGLCR